MASGDGGVILRGLEDFEVESLGVVSVKPSTDHGFRCVVTIQFARTRGGSAKSHRRGSGGTVHGVVGVLVGGGEMVCRQGCESQAIGGVLFCRGVYVGF